MPIGDRAPNGHKQASGASRARVHRQVRDVGIHAAGGSQQRNFIEQIFKLHKSGTNEQLVFDTRTGWVVRVQKNGMGAGLTNFMDGWD